MQQPARILSLLTAVAVAVSGCARFDDRLASPFTPVAGPGAGASDAPSIPEPPRSSPRPSETASPTSGPPEPPQTGPCADPDPAVIASCLDATTAVAPFGDKAVVTEGSGRILIVAPDSKPEEFGRIDTRGGRVAGVTPSPTFDQDRLLYALVVGGGPSRIEKIARGDVSKTIAELPAASAGGIGVAKKVLTVGLGSEILSFPGYQGIGDAGAPQILARQLGEVRGLCTAGDKVYVTSVTDRGVIVRTPESVVWTWPDQRRVGGCAASPGAISVALPLAERIESLPLDNGVPRGVPAPRAEKKYGRLDGLTGLGQGLLLATTTNKDGGSPSSTDDRAVIIPEDGAAGDSRV